MTIQVERKGARSRVESGISTGGKAQEMPMFPMKGIEGFDMKNLKLNEFKKHYGRGYSRMSQTQTIDVKPSARVDTFA